MWSYSPLLPASARLLGVVSIDTTWASTEIVDSCLISTSSFSDSQWNSVEDTDQTSVFANLSIDTTWASTEIVDSCLISTSSFSDSQWNSVEDTDQTSVFANLSIDSVWQSVESVDLFAISQEYYVFEYGNRKTTINAMAYESILASFVRKVTIKNNADSRLTMNHYTIGDTISIQAQLTLNGIGEVLTDYVVKCAIVCRDMKTLATGTLPVTCTMIDALTGNVEAVFVKTDTANIVAGEYWIEFQASYGGSCVTYARVLVKFLNGAIP